MFSASKTIFLVADQPWQVRIFMELVRHYSRKDSQHRFKILISDYYTFLHQPALLNELNRENISFSSLEPLYRSWQLPGEPEIFGGGRDKYENLLGGEDILSTLEHSNPWIFGDERNYYFLPISEAWREKIFIDTLMWCDQQLSISQPTLIVSIERATLPNNVIYEMAQRRNIPHLCFIPSRIGTYWCVREDFARGTSNEFKEMVLNADYSDLEIWKTQHWIDDFIKSKLGTYRSLEEALTESLKTRSLKKINVLIHDIFHFCAKVYARFFLERKNFSYRILRLEQDFIRLTISDFKQLALSYLYAVKAWNPFQDIPSGRRYFIWALHSRPEGSVLALNNGGDEIKQLLEFANQLPADVVVVVKENIEMLGLRRSGFYSKLRDHPRVELLSPEVRLFDLIPDSLGVVGVSGTFLLEGAIYGKPVYAFGDPEFKGFLHDITNSGASEFVKMILENPNSVWPNEIKKYLAYVFSRGFDVGFALFDNRAYDKDSVLIKKMKESMDFKLN